MGSHSTKAALAYTRTPITPLRSTSGGTDSRESPKLSPGAPKDFSGVPKGASGTPPLSPGCTSAAAQVTRVLPPRLHECPRPGYANAPARSLGEPMGSQKGCGRPQNSKKSHI